MSESKGRRVTVMTSVHPPFDVRIFHREAKTLAAAGYEVLLLAPYIEDQVKDGVRLSPLPPSSRSRLSRPLRWPPLLWKALRSRADVYHFHDPELLPFGLLIRFLTRRPVIYDSHEFLAETVSARLWIPAFLRPLLGRTAEVVEKWTARRLSAVVTANEEMAQGFRKAGSRALAVHNYPADYFRDRAPAPAGEHRPIAIYVGGINRDRGLEVILEATPLIKARMPGASVHLLGPVDWTGVHPRFRDSGQGFHRWGVEYRGIVNPERVPAYLERAAVGWVPLLPTPNYVRSFPTKLFEYMAAALPVVVSDYDPMGQFVRETGCGLTAEAGNARDHGEKILHLLSSPDEAAEMGRRGLEAFRTTYNWEVEKEKLLGLYGEVISEASQGVRRRS